MSKGNQMLFHALESGKPITPQIVAEIKRQITDRQLTPGMALPGTRMLAFQLGVHRQTVVTAYDRLISQGWLCSRKKKGTFVADQPPVSKQRSGKRKVTRPFPVFSFRVSRQRSGGDPNTAYWNVRFDDGFPDLASGPYIEFTAAYKRNLESMRKKNDVLKTPVEEGIISEMDRILRQRGIEITRDHFCLVRGSFQTALFLVLKTLVEGSEDFIVVEQPGNEKVWSTVIACGAQAVPVAVDGDGLRVDRIERLCRAKKVKAVIVTPQSHFPTTVMLSAPRRELLHTLSLKFGFAIIELDLEAEFWYEAPIYRLAAHGLDTNVIYINSISAMVPSLAMINYILGPVDFVCSLLPVWKEIDKQGDVILKRTLQEMLGEGVLSRYARKASNIYQLRRDRMLTSLQKHCRTVASWHVPQGGLAVWLEFDKRISMSKLLRAIAEEGVYVPSPAAYYINGKVRNGLRIGFAVLDGERQEKGIRLIGAHAKKLLFAQVGHQKYSPLRAGQ